MKNELSKTILDHIGDGILAVDSNLCIVFANCMAGQILKVDEIDIIGKSVDKIMSLSVVSDSKNKINPFLIAVSTGKSENYSQPMLVDSIVDEQVYISDSISPIRNSDSEIIGAVMTFRDVSDEVRMLNLLQLANQRYVTLFNSIKSGVAVYESTNGIDFKFIDFNAAAELIEGISKTDVIGKNAEVVFPGINELGLLEAIKKTWTTGQSQRLPCSLYQDKIRHGWRDNYIYKLPSGEVVVVYEDVTNKKLRAEHISDTVGKLRYDFKRFNNIFENSGVGIIVVSKAPNFTIEQANVAFCDFIGYTRNELVGMPIEKITHPEDWPVSLYNDNLVNRLPSTSKAIKFIKRYIRKDGSIKWGSVFLTKIEHDNGNIEFLSQVIDITDQKKAESERELLIQIVEELNASDIKNKNTISNIMQCIKTLVQLDAVAVRLPERIGINNEITDYTFYYHDGFEKKFIEDETSLCCSCDSSENKLDCVCGSVISGASNKNLPFFTKNGSFWTNSMSQSYEVFEKENYVIFKQRTSCWKRGHESMAIIPIMSGDTIVGSILLTAYRKGAFDSHTILFLEEVGKAMGVAFSRMQMRTDIEENRRALSRANDILETESDFAQNIAEESDNTLESVLVKTGKKLSVKWLSVLVLGESGVVGRWTDDNGSSSASFDDGILTSAIDNLEIKQWASQQTIYTGNYENLPACLKKVSKQIEGTWIAIPVLNNKIHISTGIVIMVSKQGHNWSSAEQAAMKGFSTLLCIMAKKEKNRLELKRKIEETILTISKSVSSQVAEVRC
jgi:PAS domain S-box-containing protein